MAVRKGDETVQVEQHQAGGSNIKKYSAWKSHTEPRDVLMPSCHRICYTGVAVCAPDHTKWATEIKLTGFTEGFYRMNNSQVFACSESALMLLFPLFRVESVLCVEQLNDTIIGKSWQKSSRDYHYCENTSAFDPANQATLNWGHITVTVPSPSS